MEKIKSSQVLAVILKLTKGKDFKEARKLAKLLCDALGHSVSSGHIMSERDVHFLAHSLVSTYGVKMRRGEVEKQIVGDHKIPSKGYPIKAVKMLDDIFSLAKAQAGFGQRD